MGRATISERVWRRLTTAFTYWQFLCNRAQHTRECRALTGRFSENRRDAFFVCKIFTPATDNKSQKIFRVIFTVNRLCKANIFSMKQGDFEGEVC